MTTTAPKAEQAPLTQETNSEPEEELVYCVSCGDPDRLEIIEKLGPIPKHEYGAEQKKGWTRYKVKCFHCSGSQVLDHPDAGLFQTPEAPALPEGTLDKSEIERLANSGVTLISAQADPNLPR